MSTKLTKSDIVYEIWESFLYVGLVAVCVTTILPFDGSLSLGVLLVSSFWVNVMFMSGGMSLAAGASWLVLTHRNTKAINESGSVDSFSGVGIIKNMRGKAGVLFVLTTVVFLVLALSQVSVHFMCDATIGWTCIVDGT